MLGIKKNTVALITVLSIVALLLVACDGATTGPAEPAEEEPSDIADRVAELLAGDVYEFEVVEIDVERVAEELQSGLAYLPAVTTEGDLIEELELPATLADLFGTRIPDGVMRSEQEQHETVALPSDIVYTLGNCVQEEIGIDPDSCGSITILDEDLTMVSGIIIHPEIGISFFEPINLLVGGRDYPYLHIVYNIAFTETLDLTGDVADLETGLNQMFNHSPLLRPAEVTAIKSTQIVLDGDRQFYNADPATVWSRQQAIFSSVDSLYRLIEPLTFESPNVSTWGLTLTIKGQEVWVSGGPDSTDHTTLINEIVDPNYYLITPVTDTELHYLFVGYSMDFVYGMAAGIGSSSGFGGGSGKNHAFGEARSVQSLKTQWVIMAHEVGHLLGGTHGDGVLNGCTTFFFWNICGTSIMAGGGAGPPGTRASFFSDANDDNIAKVLNAVLP